jgi:quercetin dioxygenase-like cupin family protein
MSHASPIAVVALLLFAIGTLLPLTAMAQTKPAFTVTSIAEKKIAHLPAGPLYWRIESFPTLAQAKAAEAPTSLAADVAGKAWLFTLGTPGGSTPGGADAAEIGPLSPPADAAEYLLRVNYVRGPPGAATAVHMHPGFETFYVLNGALSQKTSTGVLRVEAGRWSTGAAPGTAMQVSSSGASDLSAFVMFVLDAAKPFSTPAKFK